MSLNDAGDPIHHWKDKVQVLRVWLEVILRADVLYHVAKQLLEAETVQSAM
jgi:hypothetical protein